jgi:hypothetical protein
MIWWGLVFALFIYLFLATVLLDPLTSGVAPVIHYVLAGVAVMQVGVAQILWARVRGAEAAAPPSGVMSQLPVVVWSLDEAPGVIGLVVFLLGGPLVLSLTLLGLSLAALLLNAYWMLDA